MMISYRVVKKSFLGIVGVLCGLVFAVACHKDDVVPDVPADSTDVPEVVPGSGYFVFGADTLDVFSICKMGGSSVNFDVSFSDKPEMLLVIMDGFFSANTGMRAVSFGVNPDRSSNAGYDLWEGFIEVKEENGIYEINLTSDYGYVLYYHGPIDDADLPAGEGVVGVDQEEGAVNLARVFSFDQTYSYLAYTQDYSYAFKLTSMVPLVDGEYEISSALTSLSVTANVIYFNGRVAGIKPYAGTLKVSHEGGKLVFAVNAESNKGAVRFDYRGTFNRQCVVDL